ncbi:hypothetical protein [Syntrophomonas curvata]
MASPTNTLTLPVLFRPLYTDSGSSTELLYADAVVNIESRSVDSVRSSLAKEFAIDLQAQARIIARDFNRYPPLPFFLPEPTRADGGRVYVPLKMRKPRVARDRVYGYIDLAYIDRPEPGGKGSSLLYLTTGESFELFCSFSTARASISLGRDVANRYLRPAPAEEDQVIQAAHILLKRLNRIETYLEHLTRI